MEKIPDMNKKLNIELADALDEIARQTVGYPYVYYLLPEHQREAIHAAAAALRTVGDVIDVLENSTGGGFIGDTGILWDTKRHEVIATLRACFHLNGIGVEK